MDSRSPLVSQLGTGEMDSAGMDSARIEPARNAFAHSAIRGLYHFLVRRRVAVSLTLFTLLLATEGLLGLGWHRVDLRSDILFGTAVGLVLLGIGIRSWAAGTIRKNARLATSGPYSLCRHPLYLGSFLMILGFSLGTQPRINLPIVAPLVIMMYICAIRSEELTLAKLFGVTWTAYAAATPRLIPNPWRANIRLSRWSVAQWRSNREYQAVLGTIAGISGMFAWYVLA